MKGTNASVDLQFFLIELPASTKSYLAFWRTNKYPSGASAFAYSTTIKEDRVCHINKTTSNLGETDEKLLLFKRKRSSTALCDGTVMRALRACVRHGWLERLLGSWSEEFAVHEWNYCFVYLFLLFLLTHILSLRITRAYACVCFFIVIFWSWQLCLCF